LYIEREILNQERMIESVLREGERCVLRETEDVLKEGERECYRERVREDELREGEREGGLRER
jgi:hypothetical protein